MKGSGNDRFIFCFGVGFLGGVGLLSFFQFYSCFGVSLTGLLQAKSSYCSKYKGYVILFDITH